MMIPRLWRLAVAAWIAVAASWSSAASQTPPPSVAAEHQILVMVRLLPPHYRPDGAYGGAYGDSLAQSARQRVARGIARKYGLRLVDNWPMPMIGVDCFVMLVPDGRSTGAAAEQVSHDSDVAWAQPMAVYTAKGAPAPAPNDPLFAAEPAAVQWHLADLHRMASGRGTRVAVIDSGIDAAHPDLSGQLLVNRNFVSGQILVAEQHGTAVAGIIAARGGNRVGIVGVAPGARLLGLRACSQGGGPSSTVCDSLSLAKALYFAVQNHADVINLSLSGPDDRLLRELIEVALERRLSVVSAVDPKLPRGGFPASVAGVIPVADAALPGMRGDIYLAPGRDVPTTEPGGRWFIVNGNSFAAAHVSGLIALLRERRGSAPPALVTGRPRGGVIDACATLVRVAGPCNCACSGHFAVAGGHR